jgi:hypothetical protein
MFSGRTFQARAFFRAASLSRQIPSQDFLTNKDSAGKEAKKIFLRQN